jgi:tRNA(Arg) A34 adenosine deaminase TadA
MENRHARFMELALREAYRGIHRAAGGPFGACIVRKGEVLALGHNRVLASGNPTLHAEVVAIGKASRRLGRHVLDGCVLYSTTEPCPMCFSAIHWARIAEVHFGTTVPDVQRLGFNELTISNATLKRLGRSPVRLRPGLQREACRQLLRDWQALPTRQTY